MPRSLPLLLPCACLAVACGGAAARRSTGAAPEEVAEDRPAERIEAPEPGVCEEPDRFEVRVAEVDASGGSPLLGESGRRAVLLAGPYPPTQLIARVGDCEVYRWAAEEAPSGGETPDVTVRGLSRGEYRFAFRRGAAGERLPLGTGGLFHGPKVFFDIDGDRAAVPVPAPPAEVELPEAVDPTEPLRVGWQPAEASSDEVRVEVTGARGVNILCRAPDTGRFDVPAAALGELDAGGAAVSASVSRVQTGALAGGDDGRSSCLVVARELRREAIPFGTERVRAERAAARPECRDDDDCDGDSPACVGLDRRGQIAPPPAYRRRCVAPCAAGECPDGFSCAERHFVEADGSQHSEPLCVPEPIYGSTPAGEPCTLDEDCGEAAPFCVDGPAGRVCAAECGDGCPEGTTCTRFQLIAAGQIRSVGYCLAPAE